ncbi:unnamed protein product [Amoebophrya sp. A120]|nr:unnamed protein product [Amoebophrya sp. A120]|eukprot:GSA120T00013062001.1
MVQLNSSFNEGGPPFSSWHSKGNGFGKVCRSYVDDPCIVKQGRATPGGPNYYRESRLFLGKWEKGPHAKIGSEKRNEYGMDPESRSKPGPDHYGDVSKKFSAIRKDIVIKDLKIKPRFPSIEEKTAGNPRHSGPGPAKYDTRYSAGDGGLQRGSGNPKWTIPAKYLDNSKLNEEEGKPGPGRYNVAGKPGKNYPIKHGTLYDITISTKFDSNDDPRQKGPGPGAYFLVHLFFSIPFPRMRLHFLPPPAIRTAQLLWSSLFVSLQQ